MRPCAEQKVLRCLLVAAICVFCGIVLRAQELVFVVCPEQGSCQYQRAGAILVQGKDSVRTIGIQMAGDARLLRKARSVRLNSVPGLYRDPKSSLMRVRSRDGQTGDVVLPQKLPSDPGLTPLSAWQGVAMEYREQLKSKVGAPIPLDQFVVLLSGPGAESSVVQFVQNEVNAAEAHPKQKALIAGALRFAERSDELRTWRNELVGAMRLKLDLFRKEKVDPAQLLATLEEGLAAMRVYRLVAPEGQKEEALQDELVAEHRKLLERFSVATVLKKAGLHDPYLEKMKQIGLAAWSRPALVDGVQQSMQASADYHYKRARELSDAKQYGRAFDEAQLAAKRAPCNSLINEYYYNVRVEYVNKNMIPALPEYDKENRSILQQIIRELQGIGQEETFTPERIEYIRKRIAEAERMDREYLPLQLKKAEFLANLGELTAARGVVTGVERSVRLGRSEAEEWLRLDASLNGKLATTRQRIEKLVAEHMANGRFKEAVESAALGLKAEPDNPKLLYLSAIASAILRDQQGTKQIVELYLRLARPDCMESADAAKTLFDLYRRADKATVRSDAADGKVPHWISGEPYAMGEIFYDPLSGGFHPHVQVSSTEKGTATEFRWEGYMVASIKTSVSSLTAAKVTKESTLLEIEPKYDQEHLHMTDIGLRANSAGERRVTALRYLNSPDFDPLLAAKFSNKVTMRGWAGNPFFHPFLWTGIFIFDLAYDELGRIKEAIPVNPDASRPRSPFSETLKFTWEGNSKRLLSISGARYRREMTYDSQGRLKSEKISYPKGSGKIEYEYQGDTKQVKYARCEDDFFDKASRRVSFHTAGQ